MSDGMDAARPEPTMRQPNELEETLRADYEREDERWSTASQVRDAIIIFAIGVFVFLWMFVVFLTEPGIR